MVKGVPGGQFCDNFSVHTVLMLINTPALKNTSWLFSRNHIDSLMCKGNNMNSCVLLWITQLFEWGQLFKERIRSSRRKFFLGRGDHFEKGVKKWKVVELLHLKIYPFSSP